MAENVVRKGYSCEFVEAPPNTFLCQVCSLYPREAHISECCGKCFCLSCLNDSVGVCPSCDVRPLKGTLNRRARNIILESRVYCSSRKEGCPWIDKLEKLEEHNKECGYLVVDCRHCGIQMHKQNHEEHLQKCYRYRLRCKCGEMVERCKQQEHSSVCPLTKIHCPFHIVGCKADVLNKDLQAHFNTALSEHLAMVIKQSSDVQAQVKQAKEATLSIQAKRIKKLDNDIAHQTQAIAKAEETVESLGKVVQATEVELTFLESEKEKCENSCKAESIRKDAELQELKTQTNAVQKLAKVKHFGVSVERYMQVYSRPTRPVTLQFSQQIKFVVSDFTDKVNNDALWLSPPFYTHNRGYKFCLVVHCNGNVKGHSKWLSIFAYLVKGENDNRLNWPFTGSFTVQLHNQVNAGFHITKTIQLNDETDPTGECRSRVTDGYFGKESHGYWNFVTQKVLFPSSLNALSTSSRYVVNDSIEISVFNFHVS